MNEVWQAPDDPLVFTMTVPVNTLTMGAEVKEDDRITVTTWQPSTRILPLPGPQDYEGKPPARGRTFPLMIQRQLVSGLGINGNRPRGQEHQKSGQHAPPWACLARSRTSACGGAPGRAAREAAKCRSGHQDPCGTGRCRLTGARPSGKHRRLPRHRHDEVFRRVSSRRTAGEAGGRWRKSPRCRWLPRPGPWPQRREP